MGRKWAVTKMLHNGGGTQGKKKKNRNQKEIRGKLYTNEVKRRLEMEMQYIRSPARCKGHCNPGFRVAVYSPRAVHAAGQLETKLSKDTLCLMSVEDYYILFDPSLLFYYIFYITQGVSHAFKSMNIYLVQQNLGSVSLKQQ